MEFTSIKSSMIFSLIKKYFSILLFVFFIFSLFAKDGDEHEKDMLKVLGLWNDSN